MRYRNADKKWTRVLPFIAFLWLLIAGLLTLMLWPDWPQTPIQWFLLIGLGPPVYILGEAFFGWVFSKNHGMDLSPRRFSIFRIFVALPVMLGFFILYGWLNLISSNP
jgi:predicted membrane channel-forming protein YqfA (hemolysin III family)